MIWLQLCSLYRSLITSNIPSNWPSFLFPNTPILFSSKGLCTSCAFYLDLYSMKFHRLTLHICKSFLLIFLVYFGSIT